MLRPLVLMLLALSTLAGCLSPAAVDATDGASDAAPPFLGYEPGSPDMAMELLEQSHLLSGAGVQLHARVVRPAGEGPFPVIAQFTPYTAPGTNPMVNALAEPATSALSLAESNFVKQFVRRGYAFAFADVRGTGDSSGCLDLRGAKDVEDVAKLAEWLGTQPWSNGNVGFIGASYPGSEAHIAAVSREPHVKAVVPVVASTSFYHYHHNDGVPYSGNHALGGTNAGYTQNAVMPTLNPQHPNYATRYAEEAGCPYKENVVDHGGADQTGAYDEWWKERNLRGDPSNITIPVLMAQGLADWNVKPDHVAKWYNDLAGPKTLIAGQWGHQYPKDADEAYGKWWEYVTAFFDTHLKGIDTGMFATDVAWVQSNDDAWHRSAHWPLLVEERGELVLHFTKAGALATSGDATDGELSWVACPRDRMSMGTALGTAEGVLALCPEKGLELVFESEPMTEDVLVSGVPLLDLTVKSSAAFTHLVAVFEVVDKDGVATRQNYGYLNPTFRRGLDAPEAVPTDAPYDVTLDLYPQEDLVKAGEKVRITLRSHDAGATIEAFDPGTNALVFGADIDNTLWLPLRPAALQGPRLSRA